MCVCAHMHACAYTCCIPVFSFWIVQLLLLGLILIVFCARAAHILLFFSNSSPVLGKLLDNYFYNHFHFLKDYSMEVTVCIVFLLFFFFSWQCVYSVVTCWITTVAYPRGRNSSLVRVPDSWSWVWVPEGAVGEFFFSQVNFLCWLLFQYPFHPCVTTLARESPSHSAKSAGGR